MNVRIGGLDVAYERVGRGPPLVFLHGALCDSRVWRRQLADLADEFTVVAWDEPGAGRSADPPEQFTLADYADYLAAFIEALELGAAHIAGLSWGGVLAQELYRRHPECLASLILADTYAGWKGSLSEEECARRLAGAAQLSILPPNEFVRAYLPGVLSEDAPEDLADELLSIMAGFHPLSVGTVARAVAASDQRDLLPRIGVPTLLLWGEDDARSPLTIARQLLDAIPNSRLVVIPGAGHASNMEKPDRFNAEVREFCRTVNR